MQTKKDKLTGDSLGVGRRKSSVARVRVRAGSGNILINSRPLEEYFKTVREQNLVLETLEITGCRNTVDISIRATGGGPVGQHLQIHGRRQGRLDLRQHARDAGEADSHLPAQ